jgi:hypothetical protein
MILNMLHPPLQQGSVAGIHFTAGTIRCDSILLGLSTAPVDFTSSTVKQNLLKKQAEKEFILIQNDCMRIREGNVSFSRHRRDCIKSLPVNVHCRRTKTAPCGNG